MTHIKPKINFFRIKVEISEMTSNIREGGVSVERLNIKSEVRRASRVAYGVGTCVKNNSKSTD